MIHIINNTVIKSTDATVRKMTSFYIWLSKQPTVSTKNNGYWMRSKYPYLAAPPRPVSRPPLGAVDQADLVV